MANQNQVSPMDLLNSSWSRQMMELQKDFSMSLAHNLELQQENEQLKKELEELKKPKEKANPKKEGK